MSAGSNRSLPDRILPLGDMRIIINCWSAMNNQALDPKLSPAEMERVIAWTTP